MPTWVAGMPPALFVVLLVATMFSSAGVASLFTARATARRTVSEARKAEEDADKADAEARKVISDATLQLMQPLMQRAQFLEEKWRTTEAELDAANRAARELTVALQHAQTETQGLRNQVDQMSKDMAGLQAENERLRRGEQ